MQLQSHKKIYSEYAATVENTKRAHGPWPLAHDTWPLALGPWPLALDPWPLALGPWPWDLVNKCQRKRHSHRERRDYNGTLGKIARVLRSPHKHLTALPDHPCDALLQSTLPCNDDTRPLVSNLFDLGC